MVAASLTAALGFGAVLFMLWYLKALLREVGPVSWHQNMPDRGSWQRKLATVFRLGNLLQIVRVRYEYEGEDCHETEIFRGERVELSENHHLGLESYGSGLNHFNVFNVSGGLRQRTSDSKHSRTIHGRGF
jgi:hypothetical protein